MCPVVAVKPGPFDERAKCRIIWDENCRFLVEIGFWSIGFWLITEARLRISCKMNSNGQWCHTWLTCLIVSEAAHLALSSVFLLWWSVASANWNVVEFLLSASGGIAEHCHVQLVREWARGAHKEGGGLMLALCIHRIAMTGTERRTRMVENCQ